MVSDGSTKTQGPWVLRPLYTLGTSSSRERWEPSKNTPSHTRGSHRRQKGCQGTKRQTKRVRLPRPACKISKGSLFLQWGLPPAPRRQTWRSIIRHAPGLSPAVKRTRIHAHQAGEKTQAP